MKNNLIKSYCFPCCAAAMAAKELTGIVGDGTYTGIDGFWRPDTEEFCCMDRGSTLMKDLFILQHEYS